MRAIGFTTLGFSDGSYIVITTTTQWVCYYAGLVLLVLVIRL